MVCFCRSAAQILQNGPRQLRLLGCAPCSPSGAPFWPLSSPNPSKRTSPASLCLAVLFALPLVVRFGRSAAQILQNGPQQPKSSKTVLATLVSLAVLLALPLDLQILAENYICLAGSSGGPFWPLSSSNLPKRTSPAWSAWLSPLLSLWWSVSAAQQPKSFKTDLASLLCLAMLPAPAGGPFLSAQQPKSSKTDLASFVCLAVLLALPLVVRFGRSAARIFKTDLAACYAGLCSLLSLWWSVLAAQQPESFKTDLASFVCLAVLFALPLSGGPFWPLSNPNPPKRTYPALLVVRFGRSAAQILQNGPRKLAMLGCAPCSRSGGPFWPLSSPNPPKRTFPTTGGCAQPGSNPRSLG